jgi:hypothetical protein
VITKEQREELNKHLGTITDNLVTVLLFIQEENEGENQFDYVTQPGVGNKLEHITSLVGRINRVFNQE